LFHSAVAGLGLLFLSASIVFAIGNLPERFRLLTDICNQIDANWHSIAPIPYSGRTFLALILGSVLWFPLNYLVLDKNHQIDNVIERKGDPLEGLLRRAMGEGKLVSITLKNNKVYVGYITSNFNPIFQIEYLKLLPVISGYQSDKTKTINFTTYHGGPYNRIRTRVEEIQRDNETPTVSLSEEQLFQEIGDSIGLTDFETVIPIKDIQSASIFNVDDYFIYFRSQSVDELNQVA